MTILAPGAAPFPVPTFSGSENDKTLEEYLEFLRGLESRYFSDNAPRPSKDGWITVIDGLTEHMLSTFPLPEEFSWNALEEKVTSVLATLDMVKRIFELVNSIYLGTAEVVKKVFARLLNMCFVLDSWVDLEVQLEDGVTDPKVVRKRGFDVMVGILRGLGRNGVTNKETPDPSWKTLRAILDECQGVCHGEYNYISETTTISPLYVDIIFKSLHFKYPLALTLFNIPRTSDTNQKDLFEVVCQNCCITEAFGLTSVFRPL